MRKIVWMFSGQGSQYYNMGRGLYDTDPVFREALGRCDEVVRGVSGESLLDTLFRTEVGDRFTDFTHLPHTHPALFSLQFSLAQSLLRRGLKPDLLLGYSLGEIVAAAVAGAWPWEAALECVVAQARLLTERARPGAMLAVLDTPELWDPRAPAFERTWVAARNAPRHFVLSGAPSAIDRAQGWLQSKEILHQRLPVGIAFHSEAMDELEGPFRQAFGGLRTQPLAYPLVSSTYLAQTTQLPPDFLWDVLRRPVRFQETVAWLEGRGPAVYVDLGPFGTLAGFLKYGLDRAAAGRVYPLMTPFHRGADTLHRIEAVLKELTGGTLTPTDPTPG